MGTYIHIFTDATSTSQVLNMHHGQINESHAPLITKQVIDQVGLIKNLNLTFDFVAINHIY